MSYEFLEQCLKITGTFECSKPDYAGLTGNFDGQGMSVGMLQYAAGQGSLGMLLREIKALMDDAGKPVDYLDSFFVNDEEPSPVSPLLHMNGAQAKEYVIMHFIGAQGNLTDDAKEDWTNLLNTDESKAAQLNLSKATYDKAVALAEQYTPRFANRSRAIAFFFDLINQQGGMSNSRGSVHPMPETTGNFDENFSGAAEGIMFARTAPNKGSTKSSYLWETAIATDELAHELLHYAYRRAQIANPQWIYDAFARRAIIATRTGVYRGSTWDFTQVVD